MKSSTELFSESYAYFKERLPIFFGVYLIPGILAVAFAYYSSLHEVADETQLLDVYFGNIGYLAGTLLYLLVFMLCSAAITYVVARPDITSVSDLYKLAIKIYIPYIFVSILTGIAVFFGLILLIVPGIIFAIWFSLAYIVLIAENKRGVDALRASKGYVRGRGVNVFLKLSFITGMTVLASLPLIFLPFLGIPTIAQLAISELFNFAILSVTSIFMYRIYEDLKRLASSTTTEPESPEKAAEQPAQPDAQNPTINQAAQ